MRLLIGAVILLLAVSQAQAADSRHLVVCDVYGPNNLYKNVELPAHQLINISIGKMNVFGKERSMYFIGGSNGAGRVSITVEADADEIGWYLRPISLQTTMAGRSEVSTYADLGLDANTNKILRLSVTCNQF